MKEGGPGLFGGRAGPHSLRKSPCPSQGAGHSYLTVSVGQEARVHIWVLPQFPLLCSDLWSKRKQGSRLHDRPHCQGTLALCLCSLSSNTTSLEAPRSRRGTTVGSQSQWPALSRPQHYGDPKSTFAKRPSPRSPLPAAGQEFGECVHIPSAATSGASGDLRHRCWCVREQRALCMEGRGILRRVDACGGPAPHREPCSSWAHTRCIT